jgi:hypothetical protein
MYMSFEGGKMTSTLVNLDLEEMCFCLSQAILVHIENGDYFYEDQNLESMIQEENDEYSDEFDSSDEERKAAQPMKKSLNTISEKTLENTNEQEEEIDFEESR